jgi:N-acetyl-gamma-glutamyl-phosphate reductase
MASAFYSGSREMKKIKVGIFGGSGYGGAELIRILLLHPQVKIDLVTANEHAGKAVGDVHRNLYGLTDLRFEKAPADLDALSSLDCVFLALPHGQAMEIAPKIPANVKVIDLSGDFRLDDAAEFAEHYGREHTALEMQREYIYGLTDQQSRLFCDRDATRACASCCEGIDYRSCRGRREDRIERFGGKTGGKHASSAKDELVLCI